LLRHLLTFIASNVNVASLSPKRSLQEQGPQDAVPSVYC
jgi:hypothetical protein